MGWSGFGIHIMLALCHADGNILCCFVFHKPIGTVERGACTATSSLEFLLNQHEDMHFCTRVTNSAVTS